LSLSRRPLTSTLFPYTTLFRSMSLDPDNGNLYVANDVGNSILVFRETDQGNVAPARVIKGNKTGLSHPAGISVDLKNKEVWVSRSEEHTSELQSRSDLVCRLLL